MLHRCLFTLETCLHSKTYLHREGFKIKLYKIEFHILAVSREAKGREAPE